LTNRGRLAEWNDLYQFYARRGYAKTTQTPPFFAQGCLESGDSTIWLSKVRQVIAPRKTSTTLPTA
jgi:hypothetical protein